MSSVFDGRVGEEVLDGRDWKIRDDIWEDKRRGIRADRKELGLGRIPGRIRDLVMNNVRVRQCFDLALHNSWDYQRFLEVALAELCDHNQACFDKTVADAMSAAFPADPKALQAFYCPQTLPQPTMIERVRKRILEAQTLCVKIDDEIGFMLINSNDVNRFHAELAAFPAVVPPPAPFPGSVAYFDGVFVYADDHVVEGDVQWLRKSLIANWPNRAPFRSAAEAALGPVGRRVAEEGLAAVCITSSPEAVPQPPNPQPGNFLLHPSVFDAIKTIAGVDPQPKDCTCPTSVLLASGCKCGGK